MGSKARRAAASGVALTLALTACTAASRRPNGAGELVHSTLGSETVAGRVAFRTAMAHITQGTPAPADPPALRAYVLYPYLVAARLDAALSAKPVNLSNLQLDANVAAFLQAQRDQPVTRALAHDWFADLAMRQQWSMLLAHLGDVPAGGDDPLLACATLSARLAIGATGAGHRAAVSPGTGTSGDPDDLAPMALALWDQPIEQPAACDGVFGWLQKQGLLTSERVAARARAALEAGRPRLGLKLAAQLPDTRRAPLVEWARLLQQPRPTLEALAQLPGMPIEPDGLAAAVDRLALSDSATAQTLLPMLLILPDMTPELAGHLRRSVALGLAYDHAPGAAAALQQLPTTFRDDTVCEWGIRIALWNGMWPQALNWLDQLSPAAAAEPRWRYWRARALQSIDGIAAATPLLQSLARLRDYYGYLAADRLRVPYALQAHPTPPDPALQSVLATRPGLIRAHELFECGQSDAATFEWAVALHAATNAERIQSAQLAEAWGWYSQAVAQLGRAGDLDDVALRYPRPYADLVRRAAAIAVVPADWVFAVMRQESLFRPDAVSRANAQGLMQLLPITASAVADRWHVPLNGPRALFDPATAVTLGAARLRELLNRYDGAIVLALAAYNAGISPVARWRPTGPMDADIWIENIAYGETRDYVEHVLEHIVAFSWSRHAPLPRLGGLLPTVGPDAPNGITPWSRPESKIDPQ